MDLSLKCLNPVETNMMMADSDIKVEITTNEDNIMYIGPVGNNADRKEEPARQTDPDIDTVPQALKGSVKQEKTYDYGVNWAFGDTGKLEKIDSNWANLAYRDTRERASQTNPDKDKEQQDLKGSVKQEKVDDYGVDTVKQEKIDAFDVNLTYTPTGKQEKVGEVNMTSRNTVKQEETNGGEEKNTNKTEITSVPLSSNETHIRHIENGKLKDTGMLLSTAETMKKLTGKNKVSKCYKKLKESEEKVTANDSKTSDNKLPEKYKRTANKNVTSRHKIRIAQEKQRRDKNVLMRKFTCEQCDKSFCNQYNLNRHRDSIHLNMKQKYNGTKKYHCKQEGCNKVFANSSNYKKTL